MKGRAVSADVTSNHYYISQTLPKGISALHNLRVLDLEGNKLEYLATEISKLHCVTLATEISELHRVTLATEISELHRVTLHNSPSPLFPLSTLLPSLNSPPFPQLSSLPFTVLPFPSRPYPRLLT